MFKDFSNPIPYICMPQTITPMKTTNPLLKKIRLFLIVLASCIIVTCIFLIIIHPKVWITPTCLIIAMAFLLVIQYRIKHKYSHK